MKTINQRLLELIKSLSPKEIKQFKKLIGSTLYTGGRNYFPVLNAVLKYKDKPINQMAIKKIYSELYGDKKFNSQTLKNRLSELFRLAEEYLIFQNIKEESSERKRILLQAYHKKNLQKLFENKFEKAKKIMDAMPEDIDKFNSKLILQRQQISFLKSKKLSENSFRQYYEFSTYTTCIFLIQLFEFGIEFLQQKENNRTYEFNPAAEVLNKLEIDELIKKIEKDEYGLYKIVAMQYYLYRAFKNPGDESNYFEARKLFGEITDRLSGEYRAGLYKIMTYYCIIRQNYGTKKFQLELFKLYNEQLKLKIYTDPVNNVFPPSAFRNYVMVGLMLDKTDWTKNFIKKYSAELPEENRDDEINISYAKLFFGSNEFEKSMQMLKNLKGKNYLHYCDSSVLKLCAFFELNQYEEAFAEMDKFRHYVRSHKEIPKLHKEYFLNFINIYSKLINIIIKPGKKDFTGLEILIKKSDRVTKKEWLLQKIK